MCTYQILDFSVLYLITSYLFYLSKLLSQLSFIENLSFFLLVFISFDDYQLLYHIKLSIPKELSKQKYT